jgi:hypothetical protein
VTNFLVHDFRQLLICTTDRLFSEINIYYYYLVSVDHVFLPHNTPSLVFLDGINAFLSAQGTLTNMPLVDAITSIVMKPTDEDRECHAPKPIFFATGRVSVSNFVQCDVCEVKQRSQRLVMGVQKVIT